MIAALFFVSNGILKKKLKSINLEVWILKLKSISLEVWSRII